MGVVNSRFVFSPKSRNYVLLGFLFAGINLFLYHKLGVKTANDSFRYLGYADQILDTGKLYQSHNFWYLGYVLFISFIKLVGNSLSYIVLGQILLNGLATIALYETSKKLFQNDAVALLTGCLFLGFIEISYWNFYILAESFYCSMVCIAVYSVVRAERQPSTFHFFLAVLICSITFFTKPTGIALLVAIVLFFTMKYKSHLLPQQKWILWSGISIVIFFIFILGDNMLKTFTLIENYMLGEIVYGVTTLPDYPSLEMLLVDTSHTNFIIPNTGHSPIMRTVLFILQNPVFFFKLAGLKLFWYLAHIKPYHSLFHNLFIGLFLYPVYIFYIHFVSKEKLSGHLKIFFTAFVLLNCAIVAITSEDWDGRFLFPILPPLFLLAGKSMFDPLKKWLPKEKNIEAAI